MPDPLIEAVEKCKDNKEVQAGRNRMGHSAIKRTERTGRPCFALLLHGQIFERSKNCGSGFLTIITELTIMSIKSFIVDSFTDQPFAGNPAGVCLLNESIDDKPHAIDCYAEFNLSETAFLLKTNDQKNHYSIRYYTPTVEIDFCGHATLAASKVLMSEEKHEHVDFTTYKGLEAECFTRWSIRFDEFSLYFDTEDYKPNQRFLDAFGIVNPIAIQFAKALDMLVIEVKNKEALLAIKPDYQEAHKKF